MGLEAYKLFSLKKSKSYKFDSKKRQPRIIASNVAKRHYILYLTSHMYRPEKKKKIKTLNERAKKAI